MPLRYHPLLVALHWLLALLVIGALVHGGVIMDAIPNDDPGKRGYYVFHMALGMTVLVLTLVRVAVRLTTAHPAPAPTGSVFLDRIAPLAHWALYVAVIGMAVSGIVLAQTSGLGDALASQGEIPTRFRGYPARTAHGLLANLLILLIVLHFAAALWHQIVRRDGLMARMWFGGR